MLTSPPTGDENAASGGTGSEVVLDPTGNEAGTGTSSTDNTPLSAADVCAGLSLEPQPLEITEEVTTVIETEIPEPVALYLLLDNSGSMDDSAAGSRQSKWDEAVEAVTSFVNDPASDGIDVAIQYFQAVNAGRRADLCDGEAHSNPAVPIGPLPDQAEAIVDSLAATGPDGNTPTVGALTGGTQFCTEFQAAHPDERCVVVLVTDGQPNGCGLDATCPDGNSRDCVDPNAESVLVPIAAEGLEDGVVTFTIGMAGVTSEGFDLLDALAAAGGSDCSPDNAGGEACDVSTTGAQGFLQALNAIRDSIVLTDTITETVTTTLTTTLPCEWAIPDPPGGETLDPNLINVNLIDGETILIGSVSTVDDCGRASGPAWYYDDPDAPTTVAVCPDTCDLISTSETARVEVLFGCTRVDLLR
ncbi:MAG: VWA domain-containing protein [Polyangiaceae bacterium]|nr:VWA domain-containing protein [Polyangiaceae bacterium]